MPNASEKDVAILAAELVDAQWEALRRRDSYIQTAMIIMANGMPKDVPVVQLMSSAKNLADSAMAIVDAD